MRHPPFHIFDFTPDSLRQWCADRAMQPFRADQILDWVYRKGVTDPAQMLNLSKRDRDILAAEMTFLSGATVADRLASDGTRKLLIEWTDFDPSRSEPEAQARDSLGASNREPEAQARDAFDPSRPAGARLNVLAGPVSASSAGDSSRQTECVMIPAQDETKSRRTACISSQVGCPVGCRFCASGLGGLDANLSAGRIVEQVWRLNAIVASDAGRADAAPARISNVVFMGMGEPLANFAAVKRAVETIAAPWGMGIGARKITISTVGLPKAIERLARELALPVTLALSLHAPNDELRRQLIPWADYTTIAELIDACDAWFKKTGREITLEYILLGGVNDRPEHATELAAVAGRLRANINLIRYNEVRGLPFNRPATDDVRRFQEILREKGVNTHIRASRGRDIEAACGQLRHENAGIAP